MGADLAGLRVMITRPAHQADHLKQLIEQANGQALLFPLLAIEGPSDPAGLHSLFQHITDFDLLIFVSPNAVDFGLEQLRSFGGIPDSTQLACVGKGTAQRLQQHTGRQTDIQPQGRYDSEALLALPAMQQVSGKSVLIIRGQQGREHLAESLRARGAQVRYAEVYRRVKPDNDNRVLIQALQQKQIDIISITSSEALHNLVEFGHSELETLQRLPLIVFHQRIAEHARQLGFYGPILVSRETSDIGILETLLKWHNGITCE